MHPLTEADLHYLLDLLAQKVVVEPTKDFPFTVTTKAFGYSEDSKVGALQAKLSMMLQVKVSVPQ